MSKYINDIMKEYKHNSNMKALQVYPATERGQVAVGVKFDEDTLDELITQLMLAKQSGGKEFSIKSFKTDKRMFVTVEKSKEEEN